MFRTCDYALNCSTLVDRMNMSSSCFDRRYDKCFCTYCCFIRGDSKYYTRGQQPRVYGLPIGWFRRGLLMKPQAEGAFREWRHAYHGTSYDAVGNILKTGYLLKPGDTMFDGQTLREMEGHFNKSNPGPYGTDPCQIFVTESIFYAERYATPMLFWNAQNQMIKAKFAFQVRIRPGSYGTGPQTVGTTHRIDRVFTNSKIELYTKDSGSVLVYGLLVKLEFTGNYRNEPTSPTPMMTPNAPMMMPYDPMRMSYVPMMMPI